MDITESQLQLFGLAMIFYAVAAVGLSLLFKRFVVEAEKNIKNPIMNLEFVRKAGEVKKIVNNNDEARRGLKTFLIFDSFVFIPLYFAFLLAMSFLLSRAAFEWAKSAALLAALAAIIAAVADWTENFYSYRALDADLSDSGKSIGAVYLAAHVKWIALFIAVGVLSAIFWRGNLWNVAALALFFSSLLGLAGLIFRRPLITLALFVQLLFIAASGIALMFPSGRSSFMQNQSPLSRLKKSEAVETQSVETARVEFKPISKSSGGAEH